eukprot:COSAG02_NODE_232_length_27935_cov_16.544511_9_plen_53_part_00
MEAEGAGRGRGAWAGAGDDSTDRETRREAIESIVGVVWGLVAAGRVARVAAM